LPDPVLVGVVVDLNDRPHDIRPRVGWIFEAQAPLSGSIPRDSGFAAFWPPAPGASAGPSGDAGRGAEWQDNGVDAWQRRHMLKLYGWPFARRSRRLGY
jgi:hypothetical protein